MYGVWQTHRVSEGYVRRKYDGREDAIVLKVDANKLRSPDARWDIGSVLHGCAPCVENP